MKTYVITVSQKFPKYHKRAGDDTNFRYLILDAIMTKNIFAKRHTIRQNYNLWAKRFEKINKGEAQISIREWTGKPYASPQQVIINLTKDDGIGLEKIYFEDELLSVINDGAFNSGFTSIKNICKNDGLSFDDFQEWFKNQDLSEPLAIIHFTSFRYCESH